jgi:hypothetical protein
MPLAVKLQTPCTATIYNISISLWGDAHIYFFMVNSQEAWHWLEKPT